MWTETDTLCENRDQFKYLETIKKKKPARTFNNGQKPRKAWNKFLP